MEIGLRVLALIIDCGLCLGSSMLVMGMLGWMIEKLPVVRFLLVPVHFALFLAWPFVYFGVSTGLWGKTPGKFLCRLYVTDCRGCRPGVWRALGREALKFLTIGSGLGVIWCLFQILHHGITWYDQLCGTEVHYSPAADVKVPTPTFMTRWTRRRELSMAEAEAAAIGNAHQFGVLGNVLFETGQLDRAAGAFESALRKDGSNTPALWGSAMICMHRKEFELAKTHLGKLLRIDPDYKYGEASLAMARTLVALNDLKAAKLHLKKHLVKWGHPDATVALATILARQGDREEAVQILRTMLVEMKTAPVYHRRLNARWIGRAKSMLDELGKEKAV